MSARGGKGSAYQDGRTGRFFAQVSMGDGTRKGVLCPTAESKDEAKERSRVASELIADLRAAGKDEWVMQTVKAIAALPMEKLPSAREYVSSIIDGSILPKRVGSASGNRGGRPAKGTVQYRNDRWIARITLPDGKRQDVSLPRSFSREQAEERSRWLTAQARLEDVATNPKGGPRRTGSVEMYTRVDGTKYYRARIRLADGTRTRVDIPDKYATDKRRAEYAAAVQEREDKGGSLFSSRERSPARSQAAPIDAVSLADARSLFAALAIWDAERTPDFATAVCEEVLKLLACDPRATEAAADLTMRQVGTLAWARPTSVKPGHWKARVRLADGSRPWVHFEPEVTESEARSRCAAMAVRAREDGWEKRDSAAAE